MFCPNCGARLPEGGKFCSACGNRMAQPAQTAAPAAPAAPKAPVTTPKPKKKSKLPLVIIALVLVTAIAVTCVLLLGRKKVWVLTESVTVNNGQETAVKYEYDELGILLGYEKSFSGAGAVSDTEYTYHYDDEGRIESVEVENNGETIELEYSYSKDGTLEEITGEMEGAEIEAQCNEDGQVETVEMYSMGELISRGTYTYHDNGVLESVEREVYRDGEVISTGFNTYSESGKNLESGSKNADGNGMVVEQVYDDQDRMVSMLVTQDYGDTKTVFELTWENNSDGMIAEPVLTVEMEEDGESKAATITGEVEYDDNTCTITLGEIDADGLEEDALPAELEDLTIEIEYGDHGYIENIVVEFDGNEFMSYSYEYTEVEVPRDYRTVIPNDPIWGLFFG